jgi:hypothetical protein
MEICVRQSRKSLIKAAISVKHSSFITTVRWKGFGVFAIHRLINVFEMLLSTGIEEALVVRTDSRVVIRWARGEYNLICGVDSYYALPWEAVCTKGTNDDKEKRTKEKTAERADAMGCGA